MRLIHQESDKIIAKDVEIADSFWKRFRGLMFKRSFEEGKALLFQFPKKRKFRIHTFFVFFPIDLIYLGENFKVLEIKNNLSPFSFYNPERKAHKLVELPGKTIETINIEKGDTLKIPKIGKS